MIDGFLTMVGGVHFHVLPLARRCRSASNVPPEYDGPPRVSGTFNLRGEVLPWLDLARSMVSSFPPRPDGQLRAAASSSCVTGLDQRVGLVVDRLMGEHQTVIAALPASLEHLASPGRLHHPWPGDVALVLDIGGLLAPMRKPPRPGPTVLIIGTDKTAKERPC